MGVSEAGSKIMFISGNLLVGAVGVVFVILSIVVRDFLTIFNEDIDILSIVAYVYFSSD